MSYIMQCPRCPNKFEVADTAKKTTCPKCFNTFDAVGRKKKKKREEKEAEKKKESAAEDSEARAAMLVSLWGVLAFTCGAIATILASVLSIKLPSIVLSCVGLGVVFLAIPITSGRRQQKDNFWLILGGVYCTAMLATIFLLPGLLNSHWAMAASVPEPEPNKLTKVTQWNEPGEPLAPADYVNAATQSIRQQDLIIHVESAHTEHLADKGNQTFFLIHLQLVNNGYNEMFKFEGFGGEKNTPVLMDEAGHKYAFIEARPRKEKLKGAPVFDAAPSYARDIMPRTRSEHLLVFAAPPASVPAVKLELPASTWGRVGQCKFIIHPPLARER